jgi:hypothetical protein
MFASLSLALGFVLGVALTPAVFLSTRLPWALRPMAVTGVSKEALLRTPGLATSSDIIHTVEAVREKTGWSLNHAKAVRHQLPPASGRGGGLSHAGGAQ